LRIVSLQIKTVILFFCIAILSIHSFSQTTVKIGKQNDTVFPFEINDSNLYFDWIKTKKNFDNIEIFGMGEATHGTKEFFEIKAKTFEYLVNHCNYKVFGIEASYGECNYINDYLNSGIGNIDSVMLNFDFWTWRTQEVKNLLLWIKDYNQNKPDSQKVRFYGFDMQDAYSPVKYTIDFAESDSILNNDELKNTTNPILSKSPNEIYSVLEDSIFLDTLKRIDKVLIEWIQKKEIYIKEKYGNYLYERLYLCVDNFRQSLNMYLYENQVSSYQYRDSCMANNILKIHNLENAKMFIWAHNGHINVSNPNSLEKIIGKAMGSYLKKELGEQYYSVGFVFNQGNFQAVTYIKEKKEGSFFKKLFIKNQFYTDLVECSVPIYKKNTLTNVLSQANRDAFFIDLNSSQNSMFSTLQLTYDVGAIFFKFKHCSSEIIAKKQFDGLIYINKTTMAERLNLK